MYKDIIPHYDDRTSLEHEGHSYILHVGQWVQGGKPISHYDCDLNSHIRVERPVLEAVKAAQWTAGGDAAAWRAWEKSKKEFDRLGALNEIDSLIKEAWEKIKKMEDRIGQNK